MHKNNKIYEQLITIIEQECNEQAKAFTQGQFSGLGWFFVPYECATYKGLSPLIAIKQYNTTINIYVMLYQNGMPITKKIRDCVW